MAESESEPRPSEDRALALNHCLPEESKELSGSWGWRESRWVPTTLRASGEPRPLCLSYPTNISHSVSARLTGPSLSSSAIPPRPSSWTPVATAVRETQADEGSYPPSQPPEGEARLEPLCVSLNTALAQSLPWHRGISKSKSWTQRWSILVSRGFQGRPRSWTGCGQVRFRAGEQGPRPGDQSPGPQDPTRRRGHSSSSCPVTSPSSPLFVLIGAQSVVQSLRTLPPNQGRNRQGFLQRTQKRCLWHWRKRIWERKVFKGTQWPEQGGAGDLSPPTAEPKDRPSRPVRVPAHPLQVKMLCSRQGMNTDSANMESCAENIHQGWERRCSTRQPLATYGRWAFETWLVQVEVGHKHQIHTRFLKAWYEIKHEEKKKSMKYLLVIHCIQLCTLQNKLHID